MRHLFSQIFSRPKASTNPNPARQQLFEALEPRVLLSSVIGEAGEPTFHFNDADGDTVFVQLFGPGSATITLDGDAADNADIDQIELDGTSEFSRLIVHVRPGSGQSNRETTIGSILGGTGDSLAGAYLHNVSLDGQGINLDGAISQLHVDRIENGADVITTQQHPWGTMLRADAIAGSELDAAQISLHGNVWLLNVRESADYASISVDGNLNRLGVFSREGGLSNSSVNVSGDLSNLHVRGSVTDSVINAGGNLWFAGIFDRDGGLLGSQINVGGDMHNLHVQGTISDSSVDVSGNLWIVGAFNRSGGLINSSLNVGGNMHNLHVQGTISGSSVDVNGNLWVVGAFNRNGGLIGSSLNVGENVNLINVLGKIDNSTINVGGNLSSLNVVSRAGGVADTTIDVGGDLFHVFVNQNASNMRIAAAGNIFVTRIHGDLSENSLIAAAGNLNAVLVQGNLVDTEILAGVTMNAGDDLTAAEFAPGEINFVNIFGDMIDSIIAAGGDPGDDGRFTDGDILSDGLIRTVLVRGKIAGLGDGHDNHGIFAPEVGFVRVSNLTIFKGDPIPGGSGVIVGNAVIDPLPSAMNALEVTDIEEVIERAVARARQLGVNATIALTDREGNPLAVVRMTDEEAPDAPTTVNIEAGGAGGLEAVDGIVATSLIAATKAGTAAFLSTSRGNAFTTRTAGFIIQEHFPPGVLRQDSGPLFGVQLSSLPTSDINQLPLGLSADPGGVPLYRGGELIGGIGVEVDGVYTVDPSSVGGDVTVEEAIALAGQATLAPPENIRADHVFVDGLRLDYANGQPPSITSLGTLPDYATLIGDGDLDELFAPAVSPTSRFAPAALAINGGSGFVIGEVPDNDDVDFFNEGTNTIEFIAGDMNNGQQVTAADVTTIITQAHALNAELRAQIRRDSPQLSQVTVAVVDLNGNVLGVFRTGDAPVFGYDVAVQKARTAAFFSREDAGQQLTELDTEVAAEIALGQTILGQDGQPIFSVNDVFTQYVEEAAKLGVNLDGTVAVADRTGGFLSRPNLPDGIDQAPSGPFTAQAPDEFSPFNTGLQTSLIIPRLVDFLLDFNALGEEAGLAAFAAGTLGGQAAVPNDDVATGLPDHSLANGMQIFAGSVPLYKNGVLVGGVGVSGDGIEQDDHIAFTGATGFQEFGDVVRADNVVMTNGIRLPYVKFPRAPFEGV